MRFALFPSSPQYACDDQSACSDLKSWATVKTKIVFRTVKQEDKSSLGFWHRKSHGNSPRLCSLGLPSMALEWPLLHFLLKAGKSNCYIDSTCYSPCHALGTDLHTEAQTVARAVKKGSAGTEVTLDLSREYGYWGPLWGRDALSSLKGEKDPKIFQAEGAMVLNASDIQGTGTHRRSRSTGRRDQTGRLEAG